MKTHLHNFAGGIAESRDCKKSGQFRFSECVAAVTASALLLLLTGCYWGLKPLATPDDFEKEFLDLSSKGDPRAADADRRVTRIINEQDDIPALSSFSRRYPSSKHSQTVDERLLSIFTTNTSFARMEAACNAMLSQESKIAAERQLLDRIQQSTNLPNLSSLSVLAVATKSSEAARARVRELIADWEAISQEDYKRNVLAPDGSLLPDLMYEIRRKRGKAQNESLAFEYFAGERATVTKIRTAAARDGIVELTFSTSGLHYSRSECGGRLDGSTTGDGSAHSANEHGRDKIAYEIITRTGSHGSATITTEVYHLNGVIYRTSKVTGL